MRWSRGSTGGEGGRRRHLGRTGSYVNSNGIYKYLESGVGQDSAVHVGTGCSRAWQGRQGSAAAPVLAWGSEVEEDHGCGAVASPAGPGPAGHSPAPEGPPAPGEGRAQQQQGHARGGRARWGQGRFQSRSSIVGSSHPREGSGSERTPGAHPVPQSPNQRRLEEPFRSPGAAHMEDM